MARSGGSIPAPAGGRRRERRHLAGQGNRFSDYTKGLCFPALDRILHEHFGMTQIGRNVRSDRNGDNLELDMLGWTTPTRCCYSGEMLLCCR